MVHKILAEGIGALGDRSVMRYRLIARSRSQMVCGTLMGPFAHLPARGAHNGHLGVWESVVRRLMLTRIFEESHFLFLLRE